VLKADRTFVRVASTSLQPSGSPDSEVGLACASQESIGIGRFMRSQSRAALRAIVVNHVSSEPRSGSNFKPFRQARSNAICAISSADPESPTIRNATQYTRRQNCLTNLPEHSSSPMQNPRKRRSSERLSRVTTTPTFRFAYSTLRLTSGRDKPSRAIVVRRSIVRQQGSRGSPSSPDAVWRVSPHMKRQAFDACKMREATAAGCET
jgi:hypothetical protein